MPITLFDEDYDAVFKPYVKLKSSKRVYDRYNMSAVLDFNSKLKSKGVSTSETTTAELEEAKSNLSYIEDGFADELLNLISLDIQPSVLEDIELYERPSLEIIDKLLKTDLLESVKYNDFEYSNERQHLKAYKNAIHQDGLVKVRYNKKYFKIGRVYAKHSLGAINLRREIRGSIFTTGYVDIDIVNCHPSIILQLAKSLNITCPHLERYVTQREDILKEVQQHCKVDREATKKLFIMLLYGGGFKNWAKDNDVKASELDISKRLEEELLYIRWKSVELNPLLYAEVEADIKKRKQVKTQYDINNRTVSYYIQEIENRILETIYSYCRDNGYISNGVCSLCYDGLMLEKHRYNPELLQIQHYKFGDLWP